MGSPARTVGLCVLAAAATLLAGCGSNTAGTPTTTTSGAVVSPPPSVSSSAPATELTGVVAFTVPVGSGAGAGTTVGVVRNGARVDLPASLRTGSSFPVGWADTTGRRLLIAQAAPGSDRPDYLLLDVDTGVIVNGPVPADGGMFVAADDPGTVGGLDANRVFRYDNQLHEVASAVVTGLPKAPTAGEGIEVLGVRSSGLVVALPGSDGTGSDTAAYGGPERIATIDWAGHGKLLPALPYFNVALSNAALSPDGGRIAVVTGARAGQDDNEFVPTIVDLATGKSHAAPRPSTLAKATELYVHDLHWANSSTISYAWENTGANGQWNDPATGNIAEVPPAIYNWTPGSVPVAGRASTLFMTTLPGGQPLTVGWSAAADVAGGPYPLMLSNTNLAKVSNRYGPPLTPPAPAP